MKNSLLISILIFNFFFRSTGQGSHTIDSLKIVLEQMREDTNKVKILFQLSEESQDNDQVMVYAKKSLALAEKLNYEAGIANALNNIATAFSYQGNYSLALDNLKKSLTINERTGNKIRVAESLNTMGIIYEISGNNSKAMECFFKGLKINIEIGNDKGTGLSCSNIGRNYQRQGKIPGAMDYYNKSLLIYKRINSKIDIATALSNLGFLYQDQNNLAMALENDFNSLKLREELGDQKGIAESLNNIAYIYKNQNNIELSLEYFKKSLAILKKTDDPYGYANVLNNIGSMYGRQMKISEALDYCQRALEIRKKIGDKRGIGVSLVNIGSLYQMQGNVNNAIKCYEEALQSQKETGDKEWSAVSLNYLGETYYLMKEYKKAEVSCEKSLIIAEEILSIEKKMLASRNLSRIYAAEGKYKEAYEMHVSYKQAGDSISNEETKKSVVKKEMQYQFEKKEAVTKAEHQRKEAIATAEINRQTLIRNATFGGAGVIGLFSFLLVRSSNRRKKTAFDKQVSEVEMKALRSQMNPHFIFNALQSVNDFILKKDTANASGFLIKFSKLMRSVLENSQHKEVSLEKDIASLELYMQLESSRLDQPFEYEINIDPEIDPEETLIPPLILQPFVENSIWHGLKHKKEKGKIIIGIREENNTIVCSIEDNGVGREQANLLKQPSHEKRESLGMKLTKERLKILEQIKNFKSRIEVIDLKDTLNKPLGLRVELSLPLATLN